MQQNKKDLIKNQTLFYSEKIFKLPLITVITVVYNAKNEIEKTIQSVLAQTYTNLEYIIIDGGSEDGTIEIIKQYEKQISYWKSQTDKGIYDAMHKGISYSKGEWIIFMNAGDVFHNKKVLEQVFIHYYNNNIWFIYGDTIIDYGRFTKMKRAGNLEKIAYGMQFSHQSVFTRREYLEKHKFEISNKIGADFQFFFHSITRYQKHFYYTPIIIAKVTNGGISDIKRLQVLYGCWKVVGFHNMKTNVYYLIAIIKEISKKSIKFIIGKEITNKIIEKL